jgi:hypothetical protein
MTPGFKRNPGSQPEETKGKRIEVILASGKQAKGDWSADAPTRWTRTGFAFDIEEYKIL